MTAISNYVVQVRLERTRDLANRRQARMRSPEEPALEVAPSPTLGAINH
jgi:hypothetical protein